MPLPILAHASDNAISPPRRGGAGRDGVADGVVTCDSKPHHPASFAGTPPYMVTSRLASEFFSLRQTGIGCCLISGLEGAGIINPLALMKCAEWARIS
jgi:hypothetical protein